MSDSDVLLPAVDLEPVDPVVDDGVEVDAGFNKRFRVFEPDMETITPTNMPAPRSRTRNPLRDRFTLTIRE